MDRLELSLSETCPEATETLLFVDSIFPATVLAIWLGKQPPKVATASLGPELSGGGFEGAFRVDVAWPRARVPGGILLPV